MFDNQLDVRVGNQFKQIEKLFDQIRKVFLKTKLKNEEKFSEITKILSLSGSKNPNLVEFYKNLEVLMITITGKTREESELKKLEELETNLKEEKKVGKALKKEI